MTIRRLLTGSAFAALTWSAPVVAQDVVAQDGQEQLSEIVLAEPVPADILIVATRADDEVTVENYLGSSSVITPWQLEQR